MSVVRQLIYFSTAAVHQSNEVIAGILEASRPRNRRDGVTGLLVAGGGNRYLQVIEGRVTTIADTIKRIRDDERHRGGEHPGRRTVGQRSFGDWAMAFAESQHCVNSQALKRWRIRCMTPPTGTFVIK